MSMTARTLSTILSAFILFGTGTNAQADLLTDLDAFWTLDETSGNFQDSSGHNNYLTPVGEPHGDGANGLIGGAIRMDGTSANTAINPAVGKYAATDTFSASVWVKLNSLPSANYFLARIVRGADTIRDSAGWRIGSGNTGIQVNRIRFEFVSNDSISQIAKFVEVGKFLVMDKWVHIVVVHNGTEDLSDTLIYVNGKKRPPVNQSTGNVYGNTVAGAEVDFVVGGRLAQLGTEIPYFVDGDIDMIGLWSRALTAREVAALYNDGAGLVLPQSKQPFSMEHKQ